MTTLFNQETIQELVNLISMYDRHVEYIDDYRRYKSVSESNSRIVKDIRNIASDKLNIKLDTGTVELFITNGLVGPVIYQPFFTQVHDGVAIICVPKTLSKQRLPIINYRIKYIMESYDMSDFLDDAFPSWYILQESTIFEQYSEKTNTRVRVDFKDGEFLYFIAGASDNWQRIEDVPAEMDHVISALIFRSFSTNY